MGQEIATSLEIDGQTVAGTAVLESDQLSFRGEKRLRVPLTGIRGTVIARDGQLRFQIDGHDVTLELRASAERWTAKIDSPKTLLDKLGVKASMTVLVNGVENAGMLAALRERATVIATPGDRRLDLIVLGAERRDDLLRLVPLLSYVVRGAGLWIVFPTGQTGPAAIDDQEVLTAGRAAGLIDHTVVSFSDTHTALKFVARRCSIH